jgi:hypothetical protein
VASERQAAWSWRSSLRPLPVTDTIRLPVWHRSKSSKRREAGGDHP